MPRKESVLRKAWLIFISDPDKPAAQSEPGAQGTLGIDVAIEAEPDVETSSW